MESTTDQPQSGGMAGEGTEPGLRAAAQELYDAGLNPLPAKQDGSKYPDLRDWKKYQTRRVTIAELDKWFGQDRYEGARTGICVVYGAISGNVEMQEFEGRAIAEGLFDEATELMEAHDLGDLWKRVTTGNARRSPSGGMHFDYVVDGCPVKKGTKIAQRPAREDEYTDGDRARLAKNPKAQIPRCLIETRGEGNISVVDPSYGTVHKSGRPYERLSGGPASMAVIDASEYEALHAILGLLDQMPRQEYVAPGRKPAPRIDGGKRPGDDFNERASWSEILAGIFMPKLSYSGGTTYWQWADGVGGVKATTGRTAKDCLYVFTTSSEFDSEKAYDKFGAYTLLNHGGDFKAATKELGRQGYGSQEPPRPSAVPHSRPAADEDPDGQAETLQAPPQDGLSRISLKRLDEIRAPENYDLSSTGVCVKRVINNEEKWVRFAYAPLVVTASYVDPDGEQSVELSWIDRGKVISKIVPRDVAKRGRELVKFLGAFNFPVVESDARTVERYLAEFEAINMGLIPHGNVARWLGWQPDGKTFLCSADDHTRVEVAHTEQRAPLHAFHAEGTFSGWKTAVKALQDLRIPRVAIAAGFAATLLNPLSIQSFTLDMSSHSTKGKTTCVQCALSIWADPEERAGGMANWRMSMYAIEKRLNLVRGIVTPLDETMAADDPKLIDQILYQVPYGHGRGRGGGEYAKTLTWETIVLSTGERTALSYTVNQGAAARVLCTTEPPFGISGGAVAMQARAGVLENFGHAGPAFVAKLLDGLRREGGHDRLRDQHRSLAEQFKGDNDMTGRRAPMVAALALAERLACKWQILPYEPLPAKTWAELFTSTSATDNRPEMAMDVLREYVAAHRSELWPGDPERPPYRGWLGAIKQGEDGRRVAILPERLREILLAANYQLDAVLGGWIAADYLAHVVEKGRNGAEDKKMYRIQQRVAGSAVRCFVFLPKALGDGDDAQESS